MNDLVKQFLQSEYDRVAEAHFKSIEAISTFFRYYLLIMAVPGAAVAALVQLAPAGQLGLSLALCLLVVAVTGLGVCSYVTNLRLDTLLYARTINGVRRAWYDQWDIPLEEKLRLRVLPWSTSRPKYFEGLYFLPVVLVFGLIDSSYIALAAWLRWAAARPCIVTFCVFFLVHVFLYWGLADRREHRFLTSHSIGVDIDGVLNLQTQHFVEYLNRNEGSSVSKADIIVMPVRDQEGLQVSRAQEQRVFNDPNYWATMPAVPDAAEFLKKLHDEYGLDIVVCTHRPWFVSGTKLQLDDFSGRLQRRPFPGIGKIDLDASPQRRLMRRHIMQWLRKNGFTYQKLYLDKGSDADHLEIARKREMRYFVEDDLKNAVRLSYVCDVVFLVSQPYNQPNESLGLAENHRRTGLPANVVRVTGWDDIYRHLTWLV